MNTTTRQPSREIIEARAAAGEPEARFVLNVLRQRGSGWAPPTGEQIMARAAERARLGTVQHASSRAHWAGTTCPNCMEGRS